LQDMIDELHKYKISVYLDAVMNHKSWGDYTERFEVVEVNPEERTEDISQPFEIQGWTGYNFPGRDKKYSDFEWHWYHFSGTDYNDAVKKSGIYRILGENKSWSEGVDSENGNYDFLLGNDLDLDHPEVVGELNRWGAWVSKELNLDGMRLDAIKHMSDQFVKQFLESVRKERGDEFYAVGEYWSGDLDSLGRYLGAVDGCIDLFDVPLHYNMFAASQQGKKYDMRQLLQGTLISISSDHAVTFVDNHDSQKGSSLESQIEDWFKPSAYALILLMEKGYPCIFYGDYYDISGKQSLHQTIIEILIHTRQKYAFGKQQDYFDDLAVVGFVRAGDNEHPDSGLALLISNGMSGNKIMNVGKKRAGQQWFDLTGNIKDKVVIDKDGNGNFTIKDGKVAVWVKF
jgi:alpha-amylase